MGEPRSDYHSLQIKTPKYPEGQFARVTSLPLDCPVTAAVQDRKLRSLSGGVEIVQFERVASLTSPSSSSSRGKSFKGLQELLNTRHDARHSQARPLSRQQQQSKSMSTRKTVSSGAAFWASAVLRAQTVTGQDDPRRIPSTDSESKESRDGLPISFTF